MEDQAKFDRMTRLHDDIKNFKIKVSKDILENFHERKDDDVKFRLSLKNPNTYGSERLNLSSTATCAYALSQYIDLWKENDINYKDTFGEVSDYYKYIIKGLASFLDKGSVVHQNPSLESTDEFSLLNILSLLKKIYSPELIVKDYDSKEIIINIINKLCEKYNENELSFNDNTHPFIYYKFLQIISSWKDEILEQPETQKISEWKNEDDIQKIFEEIYKKGKYEMYRQIALYESQDRSLFDAKRLIYSLLIVSNNNKYSNNLIKENVVKIIFDEQLPTGLWSIGNVVNNDFVIEGGEITDKNSRIINISPILSSIECLNDMLQHEYICLELWQDCYQAKLESTYTWITKRLREEITPRGGRPLGWYPEYEGTHVPKAWVAGHALIFLNKYCELVSALIERNVRESLKVERIEDLDALSLDKLSDSYNIIAFMKMLKNPKHHSALIFGPPGSGKSTIAKSLAKELGWDYVELPPACFSSGGTHEIIPRTNKIFKKLNLLSKTVIFFDEVDQMVKSRERGGDVWLVTSLLPKFQELWKNPEVKFILATNNIDEVDWAMKRSGRIDFVLPMGAICWKDRLKLLRRTISEKSIPAESLAQISDLLTGNKEIKSDSDIDNLLKEGIHSSSLKNFLIRTDFMLFLQIKDIINNICEDCSSDNEFYNIFFMQDPERKYENYQDRGFKEFHELDANNPKGPSAPGSIIKKYIKLPPEILKKTDISGLIEENIFRSY